MARKVEGENRMGRPRKKASAVIAHVAFSGVAVRLLTTTHTLYSGTPASMAHVQSALAQVMTGMRSVCSLCMYCPCASAWGVLNISNGFHTALRIQMSQMAARPDQAALGTADDSPLSREKAQSMRELVPMLMTVPLKKLISGMASSTMPPAPLPNLPCKTMPSAQPLLLHLQLAHTQNGS